MNVYTYNQPGNYPIVVVAPDVNTAIKLIKSDNIFSSKIDNSYIKLVDTSHPHTIILQDASDFY